jgi:4,5-dihydroxyphthalate decarboxylase
MAKDLELSLFMAKTPLTSALYDGTVQPKGIKLSVDNDFGGMLANTGERHRQILAGELPGGECSTSSFLLARTRGVPLVALPVFLARSFVQRQIHCYKDAPIQAPADLNGKKVTVHRWNSTSPTWTKGVLQNEYGVDLHSIHWFLAEEDPEGEGAPDDFHITRLQPASRERAVEMLEKGEVDACLDPYIQPGPTVRKVLGDHWQEEAEAFFHRTNIYPMSHTCVVKQEILDENPWVAESLLEAFRASRKEAPRYMDERTKTHEAWLEDVIGGDPHEYRLGPVEQKTLNELVRYQVQQGLRTEPIDPLACFALDGN